MFIEYLLGTRTYVHFVSSHLVLQKPMNRFYYTEEEYEAQSGSVTFPQAHSSEK